MYRIIASIFSFLVGSAIGCVGLVATRRNLNSIERLRAEIFDDDLMASNA